MDRQRWAAAVRLRPLRLAGVPKLLSQLDRARSRGMLDVTSRIVVAGAGNIGCYVGGCLALAGRRVTLLLRPILADDIALHGLGISDFAGLDAALPASAVELSSDPEFALAAAQVLLVTVKCGATAEMAKLIAQYAPAD